MNGPKFEINKDLTFSVNVPGVTVSFDFETVLDKILEHDEFCKRLFDELSERGYNNDESYEFVLKAANKEIASLKEELKTARAEK